MEDCLEHCVYEMINRYIERQQFVCDLLKTLRPDMFALLELPNDADQEQLEAFFSFREQYAHVPQRGYWGEDNEWTYFIHGQGCHLTHTKTGEIIGWDVGNIKRFDAYWFIDNLAWFLRNEKQSKSYEEAFECFLEYDSNRESLQTIVFPVLEQMQEKGTLSADGTKYTLLR